IRPRAVCKIQYLKQAFTIQSLFSHINTHSTTLPNNSTTLQTVTMVVNTPATCCRSGDNVECACAQKATCSCGQKSALQCTCSKAASENTVNGPRCSCRARPAGECTCDRAATENVTPTGSTCACGSRPAGGCTCEKAADGGFNPANEIDFTTKK
ncbi:hypothetical protein H9L39_09952, partial [Fusarium oxysporum f. sp. albedinis]